jgi:ketosteroid isomerase-like protein
MNIKPIRCYGLLLLPVIFLISCGQKHDLQTEKKILLALHQEQQYAHLGKNAKQLVDQFADSMLSVNRGKISITTKDSAIKRFNTYFSNVAFKKWEDVNPPVIEFSADASMAYIVVDKLVMLTYIDEENNNTEETTHYAWVSIFKKEANGIWKIVCNVSTNEAKILKELHK